MVDFFVVDHGPDNTEEWIDLDRAVFFRCFGKYNPELKHYAGYEELKANLADTIASPDFDYTVTIIFDTGIVEKIHLRALGWHDFTEALKAKKNGHKCNNNREQSK